MVELRLGPTWYHLTHSLLFPKASLRCGPHWRSLSTALPFCVDLLCFLFPATCMLGRKEETQDSPNMDHPHLKMQEDALSEGQWDYQQSGDRQDGPALPSEPSASFGKECLTQKGALPLHGAQQNTSSPPTISHPPNISAQTFREHAPLLPKLGTSSPFTHTSVLHSAAGAARAAGAPWKASVCLAT